MDGDFVKYLIFALVVGPVFILGGIGILRWRDVIFRYVRAQNERIFLTAGSSEEEVYHVSWAVAGAVLVIIGIGISFANIALAIGKTGLVLF